MKNTVVFLMVAIATFGMSSCQQLVKNIMDKVQDRMSEMHNYQDSEEWGKVTQTTLDLAAFDEMEITGAVRVVYFQDSVQSVMVNGCEKAIAAYRIEVEDHTLEVRTNDNKTSVNRNTPAITIVVHAPELAVIEGNGATEVLFEMPAKMDRTVKIETNGSGEICLNGLEANNLSIETRGAARVQMNGVKCAEAAKLEFAGACTLNGDVEATDKVEVKSSGAAEGRLKVACEGLKTDIRGAGDLTLVGSCKSWKHSGVEVNSDDLTVK